MQLNKLFSAFEGSPSEGYLLNSLLIAELGKQHCTFSLLNLKQEKVFGLYAYRWDNVTDSAEMYSTCWNDSGISKMHLGKVILTASSPEATLVPDAIYEEQDTESYFKFNFGHAPENVRADKVLNLKARNIYNLPNRIINFSDLFEHARIFHTGTGIIEQMLSENDNGNATVCHIQPGMMDVYICADNKLLLHNSFESENLDDLIYYFLYTHEKTNVDLEHHEVALCGTQQNDQFEKKLGNFVPHVSKTTLTKRFTFPDNNSDKAGSIFYPNLCAYLCV